MLIGYAQYMARQAAQRLERLVGNTQPHTRLRDSAPSNQTPHARQLRERIIQNSMDSNVFSAHDPQTLRDEAADIRRRLTRDGVQFRARGMEAPYPRPEWTEPRPEGRRGLPPSYRANPQQGEITLDRNVDMHFGERTYLSQGMPAFGSEEFIDNRYPFLPQSGGNPSAPAYAGGHPAGGHPPFDPANPDAASRMQTPPPPAEATEVPLHPPRPWFPFPHEKAGIAGRAPSQRSDSPELRPEPIRQPGPSTPRRTSMDSLESLQDRWRAGGI